MARKAAKKAAPKRRTKAPAVKRGVTFFEDSQGDIRWHAVASSDITGECGQGYSSREKAEQGLRATWEVLDRWVKGRG